MPGPHALPDLAVANDPAGTVSVLLNPLPALLVVPPRPPAAFALLGPRPNPAAGDLRIAFNLASDARATLELLDLAGRRIDTREVGSLGAGPHQIVIGTGFRLPPGVYLVRLHQGPHSLVSKALILRRYERS